jgi:hypothetical protein
VTFTVRLGNDFVADDEEHCACGKTQAPRDQWLER